VKRIYKVSDVFVPGGLPKYTYVPRTPLKLEERLSQVSNNLCKIATVTGATKSGKTVLVRKLFESIPKIWIDGGFVRREQDFWDIAGAQLRVTSELEQSTTRETGGELGIIGYEERDSWEWIRDGREQLNRILRDGECGLIDGKRCFLWSREFRRVFDDTYEPSEADSPRPPRIPRSGLDRDYVAIARHCVAEGRASEIAGHLSTACGFRVHPDVRSLAFAFELKARQILNGL
jgi:hypothetical protein